MESATLTSNIPAEEVAALEAMMSRQAQAREERANRGRSYLETAAKDVRNNKIARQDFIMEKKYHATGKKEWNPYR